ncbi:MAG TPA: TetR/AcrR family transcriptional regulator [Candidatus Acidoferrales bacterium]|nr:TetR/AcrR family transcriptional regulator [Candidatus Acidoferrales bacterium]
MKRRKSIEPGLRELNKLEKRQRIRAAVRELFSRHGYETATLRQIAKRAHVGLGTLFNYAQDKQDLVFLVFNEELAAVTTEALNAARVPRRVLDQLLALSRQHYRFFAKNPVLSRILLKELTFYSEGKQAAEFQRIRGRLLAGIEEVVRTAQREKQIRSDEDAALIARHIFLVFAGALRWWIAGRRPDPAKGLADLKRLLELQIGGLRLPPGNGHRSSKHSRGSRNSRAGARPRD